MPMVQQVDKSVPVYVMDDGVMTSGASFFFTSIEHVAATCLPLVRAIAKKHHTVNGTNATNMKIVLAGWSYGGVVASEVAKMLKAVASSVSEDVIEVTALILFDSPLRAPKGAQEEQSETEIHDAVPQNSALAAANASTSSSSSSSFDLEARTQQHFSACTSLLRTYYHRELDAQAPLQCTVCDVRPMETDYDCGPEAVEQLTSGSIIRHTVPGTHWTMLFQDNVLSVAKILKEFL